MQVLLVEDDGPLANLFRVQLLHLGDHTLIITATQEAAMTAFQTKTFDLIFVDMGLEGHKDRGLEILAEIKTLLPQQRVGILSSNDARDVVRLSQQHGAEFYMVKPFTLDGLALILEGNKEAIRDYFPEVGEGRIITF